MDKLETICWHTLDVIIRTFLALFVVFLLGQCLIHLLYFGSTKKEKKFNSLSVRSQLKLSHPDHVLVKNAAASEATFERALQAVA